LNFFRFCWDNKQKTSEKYELYIRKKQDYYQVKTYMNHIANVFKNLNDPSEPMMNRT